MEEFGRFYQRLRMSSVINKVDTVNFWRFVWRYVDNTPKWI